MSKEEQKNKEMFWFKRPKNMTSKELHGLPIGPVANIEREWTIQEMVAGLMKGGRKYCEAIVLEQMATPIENDDLLMWMDKDGRQYTFGQYKNGAWFKQGF